MQTTCLRKLDTLDMVDTALPATLLQAYQATHYQVEGADWFLQLGQPQPALKPYFQRHAVHCATYLTACNPLGELLPDHLNTRRMEQLRQALQRAGWSWMEGKGHAPQGDWPGEESVLVWGMTETTARAWGQQWNQNAVVHVGADYIPRLVLLR